MQVIIQVAVKDNAKAWAFLVRHSPCTALPDHTFVVSEEATHALRDAGIRFAVISRDPASSAQLNEVASGERI